MSTPARKHSFTATAEKSGNEVVLLLTGYIWPENENASAAIASQLVTVEEGDTLTVLIRNLYGGDTDEGIAIYHDLVSYKPNVKVDGVCASMGFPIMLAGTDIEVSSHSKAMMHRPQGGYSGDFEDMRARADRNEACYNELAQIIATRTGLTTDQVKEQFMPKGKDVWFSPAKLLEMKIANRVTKGSLLKNTVALREVAKLRKPEDILERFTACLEEEEANGENNDTTTTMNKELLKKLGLPETATQAEYDAAVEARLTKADADSAALNSARDAEKARTNNELKELLDQMVKDNAMLDATRTELMKQAADGDVALVLATVRAMKSAVKPHTGVGAQLEGKDSAAAKKAAERIEWTYNEWASKDPKGLEEMRDKDNARFQELKKNRPVTRK